MTKESTLIFWGWGRKTISRALDGSTAVTRVYRYLHVFFIFSFAWGGQYLLATLTDAGWAQRSVTKEEALSLMGGDDLQPPLWRRYSLPAVIVLLVLISLISQ